MNAKVAVTPHRKAISLHGPSRLQTSNPRFLDFFATKIVPTGVCGAGGEIPWGFSAVTVGTSESEQYGSVLPTVASILTTSILAKFTTRSRDGGVGYPPGADSTDNADSQTVSVKFLQGFPRFSLLSR